MRVFITGMTGTLGTALMRHHEGDAVFGCSRSEERARAWLADHGRAATLFLADAASLADPSSDVGRLLPTLDRVYHCAAMKHVDLCEANPVECHRQNVERTAVVSAACKLAGVPLVFVSSDKACLPEATYGASKLLAERVALREGAAVVRFGNLIGSSGSVFQAWKEAVARGQRIRLTDPEMTRYFLPVAEAAEFLAAAEPGEVSFPAGMKSARLGDLADCVAKKAAARAVERLLEGAPRPPLSSLIEVMGARPGETTHQWLVAPGNAAYPNGLCSDTAPRWDTQKLLSVAGVRA